MASPVDHWSVLFFNANIHIVYDIKIYRLLSALTYIFNSKCELRARIYHSKI